MIFWARLIFYSNNIQYDTDFSFIGFKNNISKKLVENNTH